jgi:hypothetical protein
VCVCARACVCERERVSERVSESERVRESESERERVRVRERAREPNTQTRHLHRTLAHWGACGREPGTGTCASPSNSSCCSSATLPAAAESPKAPCQPLRTNSRSAHCRLPRRIAHAAVHPAPEPAASSAPAHRGHLARANRALPWRIPGAAQARTFACPATRARTAPTNISKVAPSHSSTKDAALRVVSHCARRPGVLRWGECIVPLQAIVAQSRGLGCGRASLGLEDRRARASTPARVRKRCYVPPPGSSSPGHRVRGRGRPPSNACPSSVARG